MTPRARGLSETAAALALRLDGPNQLPPAPLVPVWRRVLAALREPLVLVLLGAVTLTAVSGDLPDTLVILLVIVVNTALGVHQERRADQETRALETLVPVRTEVVRDGRSRSVSSVELVRGDLVILRAGDLVAADARLVEASMLEVDESALTGESAPVEKGCPAEGDAGLVFAGTAVVRGRGRAVVTATGTHSTLGRVAALMSGGRTRTPLQRRMAQLSVTLAVGITALSAVVLVLGLLRGEPPETMVLTAVSLVVAAVPESLPAVVTITLALAGRRMAARHAVVRSLAAAETLGSVTLLATDKTGTLTRAVMEVSDVWVAPGRTAADLWRAVALCNDASVGQTGPGSGDGVQGDPTDVALVRAATAAGVDVDRCRRAWPRSAETPFDRARRRMTTTHTADDGSWLITKGAPEAVLRPGSLDPAQDDLERARAEAARLAATGARVIAVADARAAAGRADSAPLRLLGLLALADPPRANAPATVGAARGAGLRVALVTGDHPATAAAMAHAVGITDDRTDAAIVPAGDVTGLLDEPVIARATPSDKLALVEGWQAAGQVVAMTGDGVNDGPALRRADVGVAMGGRGTEVARQAADVILTDDDLGTIVAAIEEGRRVYANIRRFLLYALTGGLAELVVMLAGPALGQPLPLLPAQLLWVNLVTHSFAGTALGAQPAEAGTMQARPRDPGEAVLGAGLWWRTGVLAVCVAAVSLAATALAEGVASERVPVQSTLMLALGTAQLGIAWGCRSHPGHGSWWRASALLVAGLVGAALLLAAGVVIPFLRALLGTDALPPAAWAAALLAAGAGVGLARLLRPRHF